MTRSRQRRFLIPLVIGVVLGAVGALGVWFLRDTSRPERQSVRLVFNSVAAEVSVQGVREERCVEVVALGECLPVVRVPQEPGQPLRAVSLTGVISPGLALLYWGCREGAGVEVCTPTEQSTADDVVCVTTSSPEDSVARSGCADLTGPITRSVERTEVIEFAPVDGDGVPVAGYSVIDGKYPADDCVPAYSATAPDIVSCFPSVLNAQACWVEAGRETVLCGRPGSNVLRRHEVRELPDRIEPRTDEQRAPLAIELRDGTMCTMRWGGPAPLLPEGLSADYGCAEHGLLVERSGAPLLAEEDPFWTVEIFRPADVDSSAAPKRLEVAALYYAGRA